MTTITTRTVHISVKNFTLDDMFRSVVGPVSGTGDSVSITLPSDMQVGDPIIGFIVMDKNQSVIDVAPGLTGAGLNENEGYIGSSGFYAETVVSAFLPGSYTDINTGFAFQFFSKRAETGDIGGTLSFDIVNHDPGGGATGTCDNYIYVVYVLNSDVSVENTETYTVYSFGAGTFENSPYTTPAEQDLYWLASNSGSFSDSATGLPAESGGLTTAKANEVIFSVCASHGNVTVTPHVSERELCDVSNGSYSLFVGCKIQAAVGATGNRVFVQSGEAYSITYLLGIEDF